MITRRKKPLVRGEAIKTLPDGREVCQDNAAGFREYKARTNNMFARQHGICCLYRYAPMCPGRMYGNVTFDHEAGRGMNGSKRDDRIEIDGRWINGAAHYACNSWKGSRNMPYNVPVNSFAKGIKDGSR